MIPELLRQLAAVLLIAVNVATWVSSLQRRELVERVRVIPRLDSDWMEL